MSRKPPTPPLETAMFALTVASAELLLLLGQHPEKQSPALLFLMFCFYLLSSAGVMLLYSRSDPLSMFLIPKVAGKKIPPTPLNTAMFILTVTSGGLLFLLGQYPEDQSRALLFLMFCFFLLSTAGVMLLCSRGDPLSMFLIPKVVGKIIPPTSSPLDTAMFVLTVASGGLLPLLGQHPEEQSSALLFLMFCFFLLSSAGVMLLCSRSDPLWVLLTPEVMRKILSPAPLLATAKFVLAIASGGLLLLLGQHPEEESAALLFFIFCSFQISSAAIMLLCSPLATALIKRQ